MCRSVYIEYTYALIIIRQQRYVLAIIINLTIFFSTWNKHLYVIYSTLQCTISNDTYVVYYICIYKLFLAVRNRTGLVGRNRIFDTAKLYNYPDSSISQRDAVDCDISCNWFISFATKYSDAYWRVILYQFHGSFSRCNVTRKSLMSLNTLCSRVNILLISSRFGFSRVGLS